MGRLTSQTQRGLGYALQREEDARRRQAEGRLRTALQGEDYTRQAMEREQQSALQREINQRRQQVEEDYNRARREAIRSTPIPTRPQRDWSEAVEQGYGTPQKPMIYRGTPDEAGQEAVKARQQRLAQIDAAKKQAIGEKLPLSMRQMLAQQGSEAASRKLEEYKKGLSQIEGLAPDEIERRVGEFQRQTFGAGRMPDVGTGQATGVFELPGEQTGLPAGEESVRAMLDRERQTQQKTEMQGVGEELDRARLRKMLNAEKAFDPMSQKERMVAGKPVMSGLGRELVMGDLLKQYGEKKRVEQEARTAGEKARLEQRFAILEEEYLRQGMGAAEARERALRDAFRTRDEPQQIDVEPHMMAEPEQLGEDEVKFGISVVDAALKGDTAALAQVGKWFPGYDVDEEALHMLMDAYNRRLGSYAKPPEEMDETDKLIKQWRETGMLP